MALVTMGTIVQGANSVIETEVAGAALTAGFVVRRGTDGKMELALNDTSTNSNVYGIVLTDTDEDCECRVLRSGSITIGGTPLTAGVTYYLGDTAGRIGIRTDVTTGEYVVIIGVATTTSVLKVNFFNPGVVSA